MGRSVSLFILLGVAVGCASNGDPLTPDGGLAGTGAVYVLRSVAGATLPAVWISNESVTVTVRADTIRLFSGGRGGRIVVAEYEEAVPSPRGFGAKPPTSISREGVTASSWRSSVPISHSASRRPTSSGA